MNASWIHIWWRHDFLVSTAVLEEPQTSSHLFWAALQSKTAINRIMHYHSAPVDPNYWTRDRQADTYSTIISLVLSGGSTERKREDYKKDVSEDLEDTNRLYRFSRGFSLDPRYFPVELLSFQKLSVSSPSMLPENLQQITKRRGLIMVLQILTIGSARSWEV